MCKNKEIILIAVVAVIAIIGLILMLKFSGTGLGIYGRGSFFPGTAVDKYSNSFAKAGNTGGVKVEMYEIPGRLECTGYDPCPAGYNRIAKKQYWNSYGYYRDMCVEPVCASSNVNIMCCPPKFQVR